MKLLILFAFIAAANAATLGTERCTWGPAYWCEHPVKAKECGPGTLKYCIRNEWSKIMVKDDALCSDCEAFVKDVRGLLNQTDVQNDILDAIKNLCSKLGTEAAACKAAVDLLGEKVLKELIADLDPVKVCKLLDLCKNATLPIDTKAIAVKPRVNADLCTDCKQIVSGLQDIMNNQTFQHYVEGALTSVCNMYLSAEICANIATYGSEVFQIIAEQLDATTDCNELGLCGSQPPLITFKRVLTGTPNADPCTDCKQIFSDLTGLVMNKTLQNYLINELIQECQAIGLPKDICSDISLFAPEIFDTLISFLDGDRDCTLLGLCKSGRIMRKQDMMIVLKNAIQLSASPCSDCNQIFSDIQNILSNTNVQKRMLDVVMKVCYVTGKYNSMCESYIQMYAPAIITQLIELVDPTSVCQDLKLCSSAVLLKDPTVVKIVNKVPAANGDACVECKQAISDLDALLGDPTVQQNLISTLIMLCEALGEPMDLCSSDINAYAPMVINEIISLLDGQTLCPELGLCTSNGLDLVRHILSSFTKMQKGIVNADTCSECKEMLTDLDDVLNNKTVQTMLFKTVISLCQALGFSSSDCSSAVTQYGPLIISFITSELNPSTVCSDLKLCPATLQITRQLVIVPAAKVPAANGDACVECKQAISDLDALLGDSTVQQNLISTLIMLCEALGEPMDLCSSDINAYAPMVINEIISLLDGQTLCPELGLCTSNGLDLARHILSSFTQMQKGIINADTCSECKEMLTDLDDVLNNKTVQTMLFKTVISLCQALGFSSSDCSSAVTQYGPLIISFITSELNPSTVCSDLKLCPATLQITRQLVIVPAVKVPAAANGDACVECKQAFADLDAVLNDPNVQINLFNTLISLCEALGIDSGSCSNGIEDYAPMVLNDIISRLSGGTLCPELGLCTSNGLNLVRHILLSFTKMQQGTVNADTCSECKEMLTDLNDVLNNKTIQTMLFKTVISLCQALGFSSSDCSSAVTQYGPLIISFITSELDPTTVCNDLKLCPASLQVVQQTLIVPAVKIPAIALKPSIPKSKSVSAPEAVPVGSAVQCELCELIVKELDGLLAKNASKTDITNALNKVCSILPSKLKVDCDNLVANYADAIIDAIIEVGADGACDFIKLCNKFNIEEMNAVTSSVDCTLCKLVMTELDSLISDKSNQAAIEAALEKVCDLTPSAIRTECKDFVKKYGEQIIQLLAQELSPDMICDALKLCTSTVPGKFAVPKVDSDIECMLCEEIIKEIHTELSQNATEGDIQKFLAMVCSKIPISGVSKECTQFVNDYTKVIVDLILADIDPDKICGLIGVCASTKQVFVAPKADSYPLCLVCDVVFGIIDTQLETNKTLSEITAMIEKVCPLLPDPLDKQCISFLDLYGAMLLKLIVNSEMEPSDICKDLRLCSPTSLAKLPVVKGTEECTVCKELFGYLETYLEGANKTQLLDEIEKICNILPVADQLTCKNYIDVYGPYILDVILNEVTPGDICGVLGLCSSNSSVSILPVDPCQVGPPFWCSTPENAKLCNAVEHCRRHAWN